MVGRWRHVGERREFSFAVLARSGASDIYKKTTRERATCVHVYVVNTTFASGLSRSAYSLEQNRHYKTSDAHGGPPARVVVSR